MDLLLSVLEGFPQHVRDRFSLAALEELVAVILTEEEDHVEFRLLSKVPGPYENKKEWDLETFLWLGALLELAFLEHRLARVHVTGYNNEQVDVRVEYLLGDTRYPECIHTARQMTVTRGSVQKFFSLPPPEMVEQTGALKNALVLYALRRNNASPPWRVHGHSLYCNIRATALQKEGLRDKM